MNQDIIWISGHITPCESAVIPASDRGMLYGDRVLQTLRVANGLPCQWEWHSNRLAEGLKILHFPSLHLPTRHDVISYLSACDLQEGLLRITITRGAGHGGYLPSADAIPAVIMEARPLRAAPANGITLWHSLYEKISPRALPTAHKFSQGLPNLLARMEAAENNCDEALQCDANGNLSELTAANIFWQKDGQLYTPALSTGCYAGNMREILMHLRSVQEVEAPVETLLHADAVIATSVNLLAAPVIALLPQKWQWNSAALAAEIHDLLYADVTRNA